MNDYIHTWQRDVQNAIVDLSWALSVTSARDDNEDTPAIQNALKNAKFAIDHAIEKY